MEEYILRAFENKELREILGLRTWKWTETVKQTVDYNCIHAVFIFPYFCYNTST
jgi:hypothetical protein